MVDDELVSMLYRILGTSVIDGDRLRVLGAVAGPAGSSAVDLPDGGVWEVDHIDPAIPVRLDVGLAGADRSPLLIAAFGGDGALYLADQAIDPLTCDVGTGHVDRPLRSDYADGHSPRRPDDPDLMAGRVIVLHDMATDEHSVPLVRITAVTELLLRAYGVSGGELLLSVLPVMRNTAARLAQQVTDDELEVLPPLLASRLASALTRVAGTGRGAGSPLVDLADRTRDILRSSTHPAIVIPHHTAARDDDRAPVVLMMDRAGSDDRVPVANQVDDSTDGYLEIHRSTPARLSVTVARSDGERWVRVAHARGSVPLAQAPLERRDLVEVAELVVPIDVADEDLRIEVIDPDDVTAIGGRPLEMIRHAVRLGREATRVTRVHGAVNAAAIWERCSEAWQAAGDVRRAEMARAVVDDGVSGPHMEPYLVDEIALALMQ